MVRCASISAVTNDPTGRYPEVRFGHNLPPLPLTPIPQVQPSDFAGYLRTIQPVYAAFAKGRAEALREARAIEKDPGSVTSCTFAPPSRRWH